MVKKIARESSLLLLLCCVLVLVSTVLPFSLSTTHGAGRCCVHPCTTHSSKAVQRAVGTSSSSSSSPVLRMRVSSDAKADSIVYTSKVFRIRYATRDDFNDVACLLADEMYGDDPIPKGQRNELVRLEEKDMRETYGKKQYTSKLLLAEDIDDNALIGCVGVNIQAIDLQRKKLTPISSWTNEEDEVAVLANLVVRRSYRKKGIAKQLGKQVEEQVREWGIDRVALTVNRENTPAYKLYKKLGYKTAFEDTEATCVLPGEYNLFTSPCINLCMVKKIAASSSTGGLSLDSFLGGLFKKM